MERAEQAATRPDVHVDDHSRPRCAVVGAGFPAGHGLVPPCDGADRRRPGRVERLQLRLALIVAHYSSASALGVFAVLTTTYVLSQGLVRSLSSDCLLTRSETDGRRADDLRTGRLPRRHRALCRPGGVGGGGERPAPDRVHVSFIIFAVSFPLMACQDYARFVGISRYDPAYAIRLDLAWLVALLGRVRRRCATPG